MTEEAKIVSGHAAVSPAVVAGPTDLKSKDAAKKEESDFPFAVAVLDVYEGPLDLVLDLIRKQHIDIYVIPIANTAIRIVVITGVDVQADGGMHADETSEV